MGKIIKKSVEKILLNKKKFSLGMKGEFKIEFSNDSFGPYRYKFEREDCYFIDGLEDRGTKIFPLKNKIFKNTEIFLETDDIVITVGERGSLIGGEKDFIDIINIKTEKKYRIFTEELNLIYNDKNNLILNIKDGEIFKTLILDINTLKKRNEKQEELNAFFKCVYNKNEKNRYRLDFNPGNSNEIDEEKRYKNGYFSMISIGSYSEPIDFKRKNFKVFLKRGFLDVRKESFN